MNRAANARARDSGARVGYLLKRKYGITRDDYERIRTQQGGVCACCQNPPKPGARLYVDHDHVTGQVRGLLCHLCNVGIGHLGDSAAGVRMAVAYLERARLSTAPVVRINLLGGTSPWLTSDARA